MDSTPEQTAEGLAIVKVLAAVLERLVCANSHVTRNDPAQMTKFQALKSPGIGVLQYVERIHKYSSCSSECFIMALIYIDRLIQRNNFLLTDLNVHRVVVTAVLLAAKFFDDAYYNNAYYAKVGGVLVSEMNALEVDFLFRINFSLHVTPELFEKYKAELLSHTVVPPITVPPVLSPSTTTVSSIYHVDHHQTSVRENSNEIQHMYYSNHIAHPELGVDEQCHLQQTPQEIFSTTHTMPMMEDTSTNLGTVPPTPALDVTTDVTAAPQLHFLPPRVSAPYVQRSNSLSFEKPHVTSMGCSQPQHFSAPSMMVVYPSVHPYSNGMDINDQYAVLDHHIFPIEGIGHHHNGVDEAEYWLRESIANGFHQHSVHSATSGYVSSIDPVGARKMLAQVSGVL